MHKVCSLQADGKKNGFLGGPGKKHGHNEHRTQTLQVWNIMDKTACIHTYIHIIYIHTYPESTPVYGKYACPMGHVWVGGTSSFSVDPDVVQVLPGLRSMALLSCLKVRDGPGNVRGLWETTRLSCSGVCAPNRWRMKKWPEKDLLSSEGTKTSMESQD